MVFFVPDPEADPGQAGPAGSVGTGDFGSVYSNGISVLQAPGTAFTKLTGLFTVNGLTAGGGVTPNQALDQLVINTTGIYSLWSLVSAKGSGLGIFSIQARRNGIALPDVAGQDTVLTQPFWGAARGKGAVSLTSGDVIEVYGFTSAVITLTYTDAMLCAKRLA